MNRVVKSSRRRKEPSAMSRATPASSGWSPAAQALSAEVSSSVVMAGGVFLLRADGDRGSQVDRAVVSGAAVDLGEFVAGAGEADLESLDFAEPAFTLGFGDA